MRYLGAMKYLLATGGLLLAVAGGAGVAAFHLGQEPGTEGRLARPDALAWLRTEFRLNEAQFTAIRKLHESYAVECEDHCQAIQEAAAAANALRAAPQPNADALAKADDRLQVLRVVCETAIEGHVRQVAAEMSPDEGRRYLALVLPKIADFDHRAAPDLVLNQHRH